MSLKENLKAKIKLERIFKSLVSTMKEPPGKWWLDKVLTRELLDMTDFEHESVRDLTLYVLPQENLALSLKKGTFSPQNDSDLARVLQYARGEEPSDLQGMDVFKFLAELAFETAQE